MSFRDVFLLEKSSKITQLCFISSYEGTLLYLVLPPAVLRVLLFCLVIEKSGDFC